MRIKIDVQPADNGYFIKARLILKEHATSGGVPRVLVAQDAGEARSQIDEWLSEHLVALSRAAGGQGVAAHPDKEDSDE